MREFLLGKETPDQSRVRQARSQMRMQRATFRETMQNPIESSIDAYANEPVRRSTYSKVHGLPRSSSRRKANEPTAIVAENPAQAKILQQLRKQRMAHT